MTHALAESTYDKYNPKSKTKNIREHKKEYEYREMQANKKNGRVYFFFVRV